MKEEILSGLLLIALAIVLILPQALLALSCIIVTNAGLIFVIFISYIPIALIAMFAFDKTDDRSLAVVLFSGALLLIFENAAFAYAATVPDDEKEEICEELNLDPYTVTIYKSSDERLQEVIKEIKSGKNNNINFLQKEEH